MTLIGKLLNEELEITQILPETQAGFTKGESTTDNICILNSAIEEQLNQE